MPSNRRLETMSETSIVLAGVGGQGTILAAEILGAAAVKDNLNVRVSEIHGMAQRGGAVTSTVRIGDGALSATVLEGQADMLLGFELLETVRSLKLASDKTLVITSDERIPPPALTAKKADYPDTEEIVRKIHLFTHKLIIVQTKRLAKEVGSNLALNVILLGALAATEQLPVRTNCIVEALKELVPAKHLEKNLEAFKLGYEYVKQNIGTN
jgi:indolepyruvate ferredoxin oxidoreductase beta subunit